jgi:ABC-type phosphate transport system substrate-binding protein
VEPSVASVKDGTFPIARSLLIYTLGEPTGAIKEYIDWILSDAGQKIVLELGYVPVNQPATSSSAETPSEEPASEANAAEPKPK